MRPSALVPGRSERAACGLTGRRPRRVPDRPPEQIRRLWGFGLWRAGASTLLKLRYT
jgi:hypothetical protein